MTLSRYEPWLTNRNVQRYSIHLLKCLMDDQSYNDFLNSRPTLVYKTYKLMVR